MISTALTSSKYYGQTCRENLIVAKCGCKNPHNFTWGSRVVDEKFVSREKEDILAVESQNCKVCGKPYIVESLKVLETVDTLKPTAVSSVSVADVAAIKAVK